MARRVFFSFHYERDAWRAGQVRNCNLLPTADQFGFMDSVDWQSLKRQGEEAIERWIGEQMRYTTVSAVLIGAETAQRPWVRHEIIESWNRGNGMVGVRIHNIRDQNRMTDLTGSNPFDQFQLPDRTLLSSVCKTYDWVIDDGRNNLGSWLEEAVEGRTLYAAGDQVVKVAEVAPSFNAVRSLSASAAFSPRSPWCVDAADRR